MQIICDFDGTIVPEDVTDNLLEQFALPEWRTIEDQWQQGLISARRCMKQQIALLRVELDTLDRFVDQIQIDPHFSDFVHWCQQQAVELLVVSDGLDYVIRRVLGCHGLEHLPIHANRLVPLEAGQYRLEFPNANPVCTKGAGTCKCQVAALAGVGQPNRLFCAIGDGASDFCIAAKADLVLAKDRLLDHCRMHRINHQTFADFAEIRCQLTERLHHHLASVTPNTVLVRSSLWQEQAA